MKFRNTLAIAVLFIALGAYLYLVESQKVREESQKKTLISLKVEDVRGVALTYPDKEIVLKKGAAGWRLEKPIDAEADETTVQNLVQAVADAELKRTIDAKEAGAPEVYGLDKPAAIVTLTLADGKTLPAIHVGKTSPVGYSTFVQFEGSPEVKLVSSAFSTGMKKEVKDLRNKVIVDFKDDDVQKIEITGSDPSLELARDGSDWKIEKPQPLRADAAEVRSFLSSLKSLRAQDFPEATPSLADYGLDSPRRRITLLIGKDLARKEILVGGEKDKGGKKELYVKRGEGDTIYALATWAWSSLQKGLSTFRDKTVLVFDRSSLATVEVARRDGETFKLVRRDKPSTTPAPTPAKESWAVEGGAASKEAQVTQLVGDLNGLKGYEIAAEKATDLAAFGLASPDLTFSLIDKEGKPLGRVLLGRVAGSGEGEKKDGYAMAEGTGTVFKVRDYLYSHLDKKRADLVEPEPGVAQAPTVAPPEPVEPEAGGEDEEAE